jgi:DNA-damage-inducible protein J
MVSTTSITIRMDEQLKRQAEALFADLGMNMTTAFTIFTRAAVRQGKIPFEIASDPFFCETNQEHLRAAIERMKLTGGTEHELIEE